MSIFIYIISLYYHYYFILKELKYSKNCYCLLKFVLFLFYCIISFSVAIEVGMLSKNNEFLFYGIISYILVGDILKKLLQYIIIGILCVSNVFFIYKDSRKEDLIMAVSTKENEEKIDEIDDLHQYKIKIYYPVSSYRKLDEKIKEMLSTYIEEFKESLGDAEVQKNIYYTLYINYDTYSYKEYISYLFYVETYTGGAHPNHEIQTINYDTLNHSFIDIDTLVKKDAGLLNRLARLSKEEILKDQKFIANEYVAQMFEEGTKPTKENYQNFVLTEKGMRVFFNYYQIAPYYFGITEILLPYDALKLKL